MRKHAAEVLLMVLFSLLAFGESAHGGLDNGLVAYYPFNGNAKDESGNGNHGRVYGATLTTDRFGRRDSAYKFSGKDQNIRVPNSEPLNPSELTISLWIGPSGTVGQSCHLVSKDGGTYERQYLIGSGSNGKIAVHVGKADKNFYIYEGSRICVSGEDWYHLLMTYDGVEMKLFVNGKYVGPSFLGKQWGSGSTNSNQPVRIGGGSYADGDYFYRGIIDDVRIYNRVLSQLEIEALYRETPNQPPIIHSFSAHPTAGEPPLEVKFTCNASDPDGTIAEYRWDFDGDGTVDSTTEAPTTPHIYNSLGQFDATVRVVDDLGAKAKSDPMTINVAYGPDLRGKVEEFHFKQLMNRINVDVRAENAGTVDAGDFKVSFYLSNDGINPILPPFKEVAVSGGLAPGANTLLSVAKTFPGSIYGKHVLIRVDKLNEVAEINETNNGARAVVQFAKAPVPVYTNGPMKCSITANPVAGAPPLQVNFTANAGEPGQTIIKYRWDFDGDGKIDSTTAARTTQHTYNDLGSFNARVTAVSSSGRTCRAGPMKIYVAYGPDLTGTVEEFHFYELLKKVGVRFRAQNTGTVAAGSFKVSFFLSNDGTTPILPAFKEFTVPGLAPGANTLLTVSETFPSSIYGKYVLIQIDDGNQVAEINETNNAARMVVRNMKTD